MKRLFNISSTPLQRPQLISSAIIITGLLALTVLFFFNPAASAIYPPCPSRLITGRLCPGCGTLRGLHQLLHGNLLAAWQLNPMTVLTLPIMLWAAVSHLSTVIRNRPFSWPFVRPVWIWLFLGAMVMFTVFRNI